MIQPNTKIMQILLLVESRSSYQGQWYYITKFQRTGTMVRMTDYNSIDDIKDLVLKQGNNAFSIIKGKYVWIKNIPATKGPEDMINNRSSQLWIHNVWF